MVNPSQIPRIKFNNGVEAPIFGLGTLLCKEQEVVEAVKHAIDCGYRHIDTAWIYKNEKEVGEGIRAKIDEGIIKREDIFVTTKLWNTFHRPESVEKGLRQSLTALGLDYADLYLVHAPTDFKEGSDDFPTDANGKSIPEGVDYIDTWRAMEEIYNKGLAKSIGISNFNKKQIERVLEIATVVPVTNQIEVQPYLNQEKLIEFCKSKGITVTAFGPLGSPGLKSLTGYEKKLLDEPEVKRIAEKHQKTAAQVLLRYPVQRGLITIPKSANKKRIEENINIFDFQLSSEDMRCLDSLNSNLRYFPFDWSSNHIYHPFHDEY